MLLKRQDSKMKNINDKNTKVACRKRYQNGKDRYQETNGNTVGKKIT
jgi:hypothetical protein